LRDLKLWEPEGGAAGGSPGVLFSGESLVLAVTGWAVTGLALMYWAVPFGWKLFVEA
jgi:hypothetical protein